MFNSLELAVIEELEQRLAPTHWGSIVSGEATTTSGGFSNCPLLGSPATGPTISALAKT